MVDFIDRDGVDPNYNRLEEISRDITPPPGYPFQNSQVVDRGIGGLIIRAPYVGLPRESRPNGLGQANGHTPLIYQSSDFPTPEFEVPLASEPHVYTLPPLYR